MNCIGCGNQEAVFVRAGFFKNENEQRQFFEYCNKCGSAGSVLAPDVYWDGKPEENLADDPATGKPRVFLSKGQKARYLQERGLMEVGDPVHGAPVSLAQQKQATNHREQVKAALAHVKQMGKDYKRQEYLRIVKEGERHG